MHWGKEVPKGMSNMVFAGKKLAFISNGTLLQGKKEVILKHEAFRRWGRTLSGNKSYENMKLTFSNKKVLYRKKER
jgi:hypothetical protein